jgi:molybdopterin converting factor small subunit
MKAPQDMIFERSFHDQKAAMHVTVLFSSLFRTLAGIEQEVLEVAEGTTIDRLSGILAQKYQNLPLDSEKTYYVINDQISARDRVLSDGDQVRIFQLLAGG